MTTWKHFLLIAFVVLAAKTNSTVGSSNDMVVIAHMGPYYAEAAQGDFRNFCASYDTNAWTVPGQKKSVCENLAYYPNNLQDTVVNPCVWYPQEDFDGISNQNGGRCLPSAKASCDLIQNNVVQIDDSEIRWFEIQNDVTFIPQDFEFGECTTPVTNDGFEYGIKFQDGTKPLFLEENSLTYLIENIGVTIKYIMKSSRVPIAIRNLFNSDDPNQYYTLTFISLLGSQEEIEVVDKQDVLEDDMDDQGSADILGDDACVQDPSLCKIDRKAVLPWWSFTLGYVAIPVFMSAVLGFVLKTSSV